MAISPGRLASLVVLTAIVLLAGCTEEDPRGLLAQGKQAREKGDNKAAFIYLSNALKLDPDMAEARYLLGLVQSDAGDQLSAEKEFRKALELGFDPAKVRAPLAWTLLVQGQYQKALDETKSAPESAEVLSVRGRAQLSLGDFKGAASSFDRALELEPQYAPAMLGQVRLAVAERNLDRAAGLVDSVLKRNPKNLDAWLVSGELQYLQGNNDKAVAAYSQALQLQPLQFTAHLRRASVLADSGKFDAAQADIDAARKIAPDAPSILGYTQALLYFRKGDPKRALESLQKVLAVAPDHMPSVLLAGLSHYALNALAQAERHVKQFLDRSPNSLFARKLLVTILLKEKQGKRALETIQPALDAKQEDVQVLAQAGEAYMQVGQFAKAAEYLQRAASMAQTDAGLRTKLGVSALAAGETERAVADLESAAKLDQKQADADALLVMIHIGKKEYDKALAAALKLEKKQPNNPLTYDLLGGAYLGLKDQNNARKSFERALSLQPDYTPAAMMLSHLDLEAKDPDGARKRLKSVLEKNPADVQAMIGMASVERATRKGGEYAAWLEKARSADSTALAPRLLLVRYYLDTNKAAQALAVAVETKGIYPKHPDVLTALGEAQTVTNDKAGAIATYASLVSVVPQSPLAHFQLAKAYLASENYAAATDWLNKALKLKPDYVDAEAVLVFLEMRAGRNSEAVKLAQQIQRHDPKLPVGYALEGDGWMAQRKFEPAQRAYEKAFALRQSAPLAVKLHAATSRAGKAQEADAKLAQWMQKNQLDTPSRLYLADTYAGTGRNQMAIQQYEAILQTDPKNLVATSNLGTMYWKEKDPRALEYFERSYKLKPDSVPINHGLGWILVEQGELKRGTALLRQAAGWSPYDTEIRYHLAAALAKSGEKLQARRELEELLANNRDFPRKEEARALLKQL